MEKNILSFRGGGIQSYCPRNFPRNKEWKF